MMLGFNDAVTVILSHEGGYVNDPLDNGGETNFGISKKAYPGLDIKSLTKENAKNIYHKDYWIPLKCPNLPFGVALVLFDFGVNAGRGAAVRAIQRAVSVKDDGIIGPQTIAAINKAHKNDVIEKLTTERIAYYADLRGWERYGRGWTRRSIETMSCALLMRDAL